LSRNRQPALRPPGDTILISPHAFLVPFFRRRRIPMIPGQIQVRPTPSGSYVRVPLQRAGLPPFVTLMCRLLRTETFINLTPPLVSVVVPIPASGRHCALSPPPLDFFFFDQDQDTCASPIAQLWFLPPVFFAVFPVSTPHRRFRTGFFPPSCVSKPVLHKLHRLLYIPSHQLPTPPPPPFPPLVL